MNRTIDIRGMHCDACVEKVTRSLKTVPGVEGVHVALDQGRATLEIDRSVDDRDLDQALHKAGDYSLGGESASNDASPESERPESLAPLFLIGGYILGAVLAIAWSTHNGSISVIMRHFMAGFFLAFSFFKFLDWSGFVDAYRRYDLLAKAVPLWAWLYPVIEAALGAAYLTDVAPIATNTITLVLMTIGALGVLRALRMGSHIQCACLGTALRLPMTKVTLIEDLTMAAMAAAMLVMH